MLVDAHCHIMPERLARAIRRFFDAHMGWGRLAYDGVLLDDVVRAQRDAGSHRFWALPYAHKAGVAASVNEWMAEALTAVPEAVPAATFHPDDADLAVLVRRAFGALRLRVAKLHCSVGNFEADDARLEPLWDEAVQRGVAVVVHAGHATSGRTFRDELAPVARVVARHPRLHLVIAHAGLPDIDAALDIMEQHPAVYADLTSAAQWQYPFPAARVEALHERFLFGSDVPNTKLTIAQSVEWLRAQRLSRRALRAILGENAMRLVP